MTKHAETAEVTPPQVTADITAAAHTLLDATERLGPRITEHGYGCPANANGHCTCGVTDFQNAMRELGTALGVLVPPNAG